MTEHSSTPGPDSRAVNSLQELDALPVPEPSTAVAAAGRRRVARRIGAAGVAVAVLAGAGFAASRLVDRTDRIETTDDTASMMAPPTSGPTSSPSTNSATTTAATTVTTTTSTAPSSTSTTAATTEPSRATSSTTTTAVEDPTTVPTIETTVVPTTATTTTAITETVRTLVPSGRTASIRFRASVAGPDGSGPGEPLANQEFWICQMTSAGCPETDRATSDSSGYVTLTFDVTRAQMLFTDPPGCPGQSTALGPTEAYSQPAWVPDRDAPGGVLPTGALDRLLVAGACEPGV